MNCTALTPGQTARDQAEYLTQQMPPGLFGGVGIEESRVAWRLSPEPFPLSPATVAAIERLGEDFLKFYKVLASLYQRSARGTAPEFIAGYLDRGKPEPVIKLGDRIASKATFPGLSGPI